MTPEPKRDVLAEFEAMIAAMGPEEKAELDKLLEPELSKPWLPVPGPQSDAYYSKADILLFGGSAGGGKSSLLVGTAMTDHTQSVIYRRSYSDISGLEEELEKINKTRLGYNSSLTVYRGRGRTLKFEALEKPNAEQSAQGKPRSLIGFDEGAQLSEAKVRFVLGWLRSTKEGERCRVIIASNPPMGGEGEWLMVWFAPWLDPTFPNPAVAGELRWAITVGSEIRWVDGAEPVQIGDQTYTPMSYTFIPSNLDDNPYLKDSGYRERLQNMPEPLRSKLLYGDFLAGRQDHEWQVIPSEWIRAANERWRKSDKDKRRRMLALSADIALGGADNLVMSRLHEDHWFAPLEVREGKEFGGATGSDKIASLLLKYRKDVADLSVDGTGGWAAGARSHLAKDHETDCASIVFSKGSNAKTLDGSLDFLNLRVEMYWKFREALDPELGDDIALPPDPRLFAELTAQRYWIKSQGKNAVICMLPKDKQPVSPDRSDAVVMAWRRRNAWARKMAIKAQSTVVAPPVPAGPNSWMG